ncbi:MAG: HAMP domain-containing histidine kinase [Elusimicrobia bacterium]|nr:HAMP domain-containing histidine kinase [Elusimicrobiota bacterium]
MRSRYLLFFRAVLAETLLLQCLYAPGEAGQGWRHWILLGLYAFFAVSFFLLESRLPALGAWLPVSFIVDLGMTSLILHAAGGFADDFHMAFFLVILSTALIDSMTFSFVVGGVACAVYASLALPSFRDALQPFYLLRLSLLLTTAFFSTFIADHARRVKTATAKEFEERLAWLERLSFTGQALARVLHELKTPLGTIGLTAESARTLLAKGDASGLETRLAGIEAEADRAAGIVSGYLEFVRPTQLPLTPLPIQEPLRQALASASLRLDEMNIAVLQDLGPDLVVEASRRHLVQLFTILIDNAIAAMPLGGRLTVRVRPESGKAVAAIQDTGVGLTPEAQARLFEDFATSRPEAGGTGLGLSIGRWIALKHHGDLSLASPGQAKGAVATMTLPLAAQR